MRKTAGVIQKLSGKGLRIGIVASRFNRDITEKLYKGALQTLLKSGVKAKQIETVWVPGAFEIPLVLQNLARRKKSRFDGLIALGAVIRGETPHFDYVAGEAARGVMAVSLREEIPIAFGVLTTNNVDQALARAGGRDGNKGVDAALTVIEMVQIFRKK